VRGTTAIRIRAYGSCLHSIVSVCNFELHILLPLVFPGYNDNITRYNFRVGERTRKMQVSKNSPTFLCPLSFSRFHRISFLPLLLSHGLFGFHKVMAPFSCETTQKRYGNTLMAHVSSGLYSYFFSQFPWIERNLPLFDFDKIMKNLAHG